MASPGGATSTPSRRRAIPTAAATSRIWVRSPFYALIARARAGEPQPHDAPPPRRGPEERDFPVLEEFFAAGATDYAAWLFVYGEPVASGLVLGDRSQGSGVVYSFATDRAPGSATTTSSSMEATLPALSLAMKAHAGHVIASGLLAHLSRLGRGRAGPRRRGDARLDGGDARRDPLRRHPRLHGAERLRRRGRRSSTFSTTSSRRWPRRCASAAGRS